MISLFIVSQVLLASTALANPMPSKILRARANTPSAYPGDQGDPIHNELQYVNFDMSNQQDKDRANKIHYAFGEAFKYIQGGLIASEDKSKAFNRYFDTEEDDTEKDEVRSALYQIVVEDENDPRKTESFTELMSGVVVDNEDFLNGCNADFDGKQIRAYTADIDDEERPNWIHFCDSAYEQKVLRDITCAEQGDLVSETMDSFTHTLVHELTHQDEVGTGSDGALKIIDAQFPLVEGDEEQVYAYGAYLAWQLRVRADGRTTINADNYAWMLTNAYFDQTCQKEFADPVDEDTD
ncbi:hypothetical protein EDC01DRAFT_744332 [Geopyxis carbonaria]|nr:hypothetical protein EDC01DRAFT_744332 [Geopyxis carbonaria]